MSDSEMPMMPDHQRPYPGLRAFLRDEINIFFGRERQTDEILEKLQASCFLAVIGPSGCGKSSLVRTGVLSALDSGFMCKAGSHWVVADMKPGNQPFHHLAAALLANDLFAERYREWFPEDISDDDWRDQAVPVLEASLQRGPLSLQELLEDLRLPEGTSLLLLVDQFEEIFRYQRYASNQAGEFVSLLLAAIHHPAVYTIITMRSDFLGNASDFLGLPEAINEGLYLTPRMDRDQLADAIGFPARVFGGEVRPDLVNRLLNDSGRAMDQLPLLQHALMRLWETDDDTILTLSEYEATGGLQQVLNDHLEEVWQELDKHQQHLAEQMFRLLTERTQEGQDVRRPIKVADVLALPDADTASVYGMIESFRQVGRHFLMPPPDVALHPELVIDITHESLIRQWERLHQWAAREAEKARLYKRLVERSQRYADNAGGLLGGRDLEVELHWFERDMPDAQWAERYGGGFEQVQTFLDASQYEKNKEDAVRRKRAKAKSRRNFLTVLAGFVIAVLAAISGWGLQQYTEAQRLIAEQERLSAEQQRLIADQQRLTAEKQKDAAVVQQLRLERENDKLERENELLKRLQDAEETIDRLQFKSLMKSASLLAQNDDANGARDVLTTVAVQKDKAAISRQERFQYELLNAQVDVQGGLPAFTYDNASVPLHDVVLDKARDVLLAGGEDGRLVMYRRNVKQAVTIETPYKRSIQDIDLHPGGQHFVTVGDDAKILLWRWDSDQTGQDNQSAMPKIVSETLVSGAIKAVDFSDDGQYLATGHAGQDGRVWARVWSLAEDGTGTLTQVWKGRHDKQVSEGGVLFLPNGNLVTASHDGKVRFWDVQLPLDGVDASDIGSESTPYQELPHASAVLGLSLSGDGQRLALSDGKQITVYNLQNYEKVASFVSSYDRLIFSLAWIRDQKGIERLVSAGLDHALRIWDAEKGVLLRVLQGHTAEVGVSGMAYDPEKRELLSPGKDGRVIAWQMDLPGTTLIPLGETRPHSTAFSPDGISLVVGMTNGEVRLYDAQSRTLQASQSLSNDKVTDIVAHPAQPLVAIAARWTDTSQTGTPITRGMLSVWQVQNGTMTRVFESKDFDLRIDSLAFSNDGRRLYTAGLDGRLGVLAIPVQADQTAQWGAVQFSEYLSADEQDRGLVSVSVSPDGKQVLTAREREVQLWDVDAQGLPVLPAKAALKSNHDVHGAYFTPKGEGVITVGRGANIVRYGLTDDGQFDVEQAKRLSGHTQTVVDAGFIPDGDLLVTGSADATLRAWDLQSNDSLFALQIASHSGFPMPFYGFDHRCDTTGCQFAIPLRGKGASESGEKRYIALYDLKFTQTTVQQTEGEQQ